MNLDLNTEKATNVRKSTANEVNDYVIHVIMTQYSLKAGMKLFEERGEKATLKELQQLHDMKTFKPVDATTLTKEQRKAALASLMFLREKRNGEVKGRACVNGRPQRESIPKEEAASTTAATESVMLTAVIDAHERRDVATLDIPGAFLHADNNDQNIIMMLKGLLAELMVKIAPQIYRKYLLVTEKGEKILYVRMTKALYGMLKSALLFYRKLVKDLESVGFTINPYDPCVANKTSYGSQMTVVWHVDDLKVSHMDPARVTKFCEWIQTIYGPCKVDRGKVHEYLGMNLDYRTPGVVRISMIPYVEKIIRNFPEDLGAIAPSPGADHLFKIRDEEEATYLPEEQAILFHHIVAQLLFVTSRARRDIQTAIAFLTTRVKKPDEDDWGKLKRVLKYLKGTKRLKLSLSAENLSILKWWVDASHAVHEDCKSHTGMGMSLGKGMPLTMSRKQKLNGKSSTESELIAVDDALPQILWTRYFLECQGYEIKQNIIYQDNKSAILLEMNGKGSSSKRTKHIKVRYFL